MSEEDFQLNLLGQIEDLEKTLKEIRKVINSFTLFKEYTAEDYDIKMREISEILEEKGF